MIPYQNLLSPIPTLYWRYSYFKENAKGGWAGWRKKSLQKCPNRDLKWGTSCYILISKSLLHTTTTSTHYGFPENTTLNVPNFLALFCSKIWHHPCIWKFEENCFHSHFHNLIIWHLYVGADLLSCLLVDSYRLKSVAKSVVMQTRNQKYPKMKMWWHSGLYMLSPNLKQNQGYISLNLSISSDNCNTWLRKYSSVFRSFNSVRSESETGAIFFLLHVTNLMTWKKCDLLIFYVSSLEVVNILREKRGDL